MKIPSSVWLFIMVCIAIDVVCCWRSRVRVRARVRARVHARLAFGLVDVSASNKKNLIPGQTLEADACDFGTYDVNSDGNVTKSEWISIFGDGFQSEELFVALDISTDDDGVITEEEFDAVAPSTIDGCEERRIKS